MLLSSLTNPFLVFWFRKGTTQTPTKTTDVIAAIPHWKQLLRFIVGIAGGAMVMLSEDWINAKAINVFVAGFLSSAWLVWGAPLCFYLLKLN